jgi:WD40 repeat protein
LHFMTPEYASPEQLRGESVATPGDVYSLGVLLFQLLTSQRPYDLEQLTLAQTLQVVSETDAPKPSTRVADPKQRRELQGDLDNITLKALRHDPRERYQSVTEFSADLQRYFDGEPVQAQPTTFVYRARKTIRRHPTASALVALVAVLLVAGTIAALWRARVAEAEARQARRLLYNAQIRQAGYDLAEDKFPQVRATLASWIPQAGQEELRGFEWFYLWREAHRERMELRHEGEVIAVAYAPDGQQIASACADGTVRVWQTATGRTVRVFPAHQKSVKAVAYAPDGQWIASAGEDQMVRVWNVATGQERWRFNIGGADEYAVTFAPTGDRLAVGTNNALLLFDAATGERLVQVAQGAALVKLAFFPDGRKLVSAGYDQMVKVWDARAGKLLQAVRAHPGSFVFSVAVSPDGHWIASGGNDLVAGGKALRLWDAKTLRAQKVLADHTNSVRGVAFASDGKTLVSVGADRLVMLWDVASGQRLKELRGHTNRLRDVAFSPDGREIAPCGDDNTVKIWNVDPTTEPLDLLTGHQGRIIPVAVSPDGKLVATGSADNTAKLWDLASGRERATLRGCCGEVYALAFAPDSQTLVMRAAILRRIPLLRALART